MAALVMAAGLAAATGERHLTAATHPDLVLVGGKVFTADPGRPWAATFQPLRSLLAAGVPLALGSDGPASPFLNILLAVTHPVTPGEAITREQAVEAYTRGSAWVEFAEREKGTLAPGMLADLAVLSQDIFTVEPARLPATASVLTIVGGRVVYDAAGTNRQRSGP